MISELSFLINILVGGGIVALIFKAIVTAGSYINKVDALERKYEKLETRQLSLWEKINKLEVFLKSSNYANLDVDL
jgi:hypothetical protein